MFDGELLDVIDLIQVSVGIVLVAFERHTQVDLLPYDGGKGLCRGDGGVLAEGIVEITHRGVVHLRSVQHLRDVVKRWVVENRVDVILVGAVKVSQHRHRLHAGVRRNLVSHAEARLELGVVPELVLDFLHLLQVFLCEHVAVVFFEEQLKNVSSLRACQLRISEHRRFNT